MADDKIQSQYNQIYSLAVQPGIKRDGTTFESREFSDGTWCRFQRGVPKKMGGWRQMFGSFNGIARGMISNAYNGVNYIFTGLQNGIDVFTTGTSLGVGSGPFVATINRGYDATPIVSNTTTTFTVTSTATPIIDYSVAYPIGSTVIFSQEAGAPTYTVTNAVFTTPNTVITFTPALPSGTTLTEVWADNVNFMADPRNIWQWDMQYSPQGGALQVIGHPGLNLVNIDNSVKSQVLVGNILPGADGGWTFQGLADSGGQNPTFQPIEVDGGIVVLYPYLFAYGSNGFIANNHVSDQYDQRTITDWNGPTANQVNMAAGKIVKGMPVRGGTNAPSGMFWATDSLIRVSFTGVAPYYWRYDIISNQTSIMSSNSVVEMDGSFYWMGVDRFYQYNGSVSVLANDKNVNWLFNNLNYEQRQKVWATKIPRYNEIWFFYPRGTATECTDAIIYNVKDKIWYDAGSGIGARRSCGYTTEVFPNPIWAGWEETALFSTAFPIIATPSGYPAPASDQFYIAGNITAALSPGDQVKLNKDINSPTYTVVSAEFILNPGSIEGATLITLSGLLSTPPVGTSAYLVVGGYGVYEHEFGLNAVSLFGQTAITSNFTTCDISWIGGTPAEDQAVGVNRRLHIRRIEPDFVQAGNLALTITGRKFARGDEEDSGPYLFGPQTGKIDLRVEHREVRLQFESNELDGNYEMGRLMLTIEYGDERP